MAKLTPSLIDSNLWIDFTRARSPRVLKQFLAPYITAPSAAVTEPIMYEVLRYAADDEVGPLQMQFRVMPMLPTPDDLWEGAAKLGQACRKKGITAGALDLLIAKVAIHHDAEIITLDIDFAAIAKVCNLRVRLLQRPTP